MVTCYYRVTLYYRITLTYKKEMQKLKIKHRNNLEPEKLAHKIRAKNAQNHRKIAQEMPKPISKQLCEKKKKN